MPATLGPSRIDEAEKRDRRPPKCCQAVVAVWFDQLTAQPRLLVPVHHAVTEYEGPRSVKEGDNRSPRTVFFVEAAMNLLLIAVKDRDKKSPAPQR